MDYLTYRWTTHGIATFVFCTIHISVDLAHHEIVRAKVGKGGINLYIKNSRFRIYSFNAILYRK